MKYFLTVILTAAIAVLGDALICTSDLDCNLNGICSSKTGNCSCVKEWTGETCGVLNLQPARLPPNSGYHESNTSTWGGSIVADPKGKKYHMFVSRFTNSCGLNAWQQNSEIIRAEANDPIGPYKMVETILPVFAHGPSVRKLKNGSYVMMHLGCGRPFMKQINGCSGGVTPKGSMNSTHAMTELPLCNQFNVSVMVSPSLHGPWSSSTQVFLSSGVKKSWYVPSGRQFSNPAPHINSKSGTITCAYRADARSGGEHVSVATANSILGPFVDTRSQPAISTHVGEDPFLWQDERGHWHMLMHNMGGGVGSHAYSLDSKKWIRSDVEPYTNKVTFQDGSYTNMLRRERPQLLLDDDGRPLYFSTGVVDYEDHSYTLVMKVNGT